MSDPNLEELLRSPYDDRSDDQDAVAWKLPVSAAILGALMMAVYVIFAIVTGPTEDGEIAGSDSKRQPVEAAGFPQGYAAVSNDVAFRADVMRVYTDGTMLYVSSVTRGGDEPASVTPIDVAKWTVMTPTDESVMVHQFAATGVLGGIAVELGTVFDPNIATVIATLPGTIEEAAHSVTLPPELPAVLRDHEIQLHDSVIVIDELVIENGWGSLRWHLDGGIAAKVDVVVAFDGVRFPLSLVLPHAAPPSFAVATPPLPPLWSSGGEARLLHVGEAFSDSNPPTGLTVEFLVSIVTEAGESIEIPIGIVVDR
jgi:hypothetical protein